MTDATFTYSVRSRHFNGSHIRLNSDLGPVNVCDVWCGARGGGATVSAAVRRALTLGDLRARREEILRIAYSMVQGNDRVFGSMVRGEADYTGDIELLVDVVADADGFAYFRLFEILRSA